MSDGTNSQSVNSGSMKIKLYETPQWRYNDRVLEGLLQHSHSSYNSVGAGHEICPEQPANHKVESNSLLSVPLSDKHLLSDYYVFHRQENSIHSSFPSSNTTEYDLAGTRSPVPHVSGQIAGVESGINSSELIKTKCNSSTSASVTQPNIKKRRDKPETRSQRNSLNSTTTEREIPILSVKKTFEDDGAREPKSRMVKSKGENVQNLQRSITCFSADSGRSHLLPAESSQRRSLEIESAGEAPPSFDPASRQLVHTSDVNIPPESGWESNVHSPACTDTVQCISSSLSEQLPTQQIPVVSTSTLGVMFESRPEAQKTPVHLARGQDSDFVPDRSRSEVNACTPVQVSRERIHGHTNMDGNTSIEAKLDHFMNMPSVKSLLSASKCQLPDVSRRFHDTDAARADNNFNPAISLFSSQRGIKAIATLTRNLVPSAYWKNIHPNFPPGGHQNQSDQYQKKRQPKKPSEDVRKNVKEKPSKLSVQLLGDVSSDGLLTCEICEEKFTSPAKLEEHLPVHMAVWKVKCSICDKRFTNKKHLSDHMISHGADTPFECDICHYTFVYADTLKKHKRRVHGEGKRKCKECHRNYEPGEYEKHAELHHSKDPLVRDKPHECDICCRRYRKPCALRDHKLTHSNEKTYMCSECGKTFRTKSGRHFHSRLHSEKQMAEKKKKIPCKICKKEYFRYALHQHEKLHNLERKFMCEKCGKTFLMMHHLRNHEKSHLDEKPHVCAICDASFRLAHHLRAHRKTHQTTHRTKKVD